MSSLTECAVEWQLVEGERIQLGCCMSWSVAQSSERLNLSRPAHFDSGSAKGKSPMEQQWIVRP